ncbi:MAG: bifunctional oligoribonuclease and phosphatase NrnA [Candidatus Sumerlaeota bacterium]|nr:bifunctional oligoribonuclease and phosphatase NrnA [Candidatus Sumerlaeota bacterium]
MSNPAADATARDVALELRAHERILIVSHARPDGDCLGSATALLAALRSLGKTVAAYNTSPVPRILAFLPEIDSVSTELPAWAPDLTVFVDCGGIDRVGENFVPQGRVLNIDHHATNDRFGDMNYIDVGAAAVGDQVREILRELGVELTPTIATSLYTALATDTGCFRYANTSARAFKLAAELADAGAKPAYISQQVYESRTPGEVMLTARCLSSLHLESAGRLAWAELRNSDFAKAGGRDNEPEGLSSELRAIDGVEISVLFHELEEGGLRGSLRGKGNVSCSALAEQLGGGGHVAAAGFALKGVEYEPARDKALDLLRTAVGKLSPG